MEGSVAPHLAITLFGPLRVTLDGRDVSAAAYEQVRALLVFLAVDADRAHRRDVLAALLWPEQRETVARAYLRRALSVLRQTIADHAAQPAFLLCTHETLQFNRTSDYALDVAAFTRLLAPCPEHADPDLACAACAPRLQQAVELYRGDFLEHGFRHEGTALSEWVVRWREALRGQVLAVLARLATYFDQVGNAVAAEQAVRRHLALDPWDEAAHRRLMQVLARAGQRSLALQQYERCRQILADELGIAPETETAALYERLRVGDRAKLPGQPGGNIGSPAERPAWTAGAPASAPARPVSVPVPPTPLIGRVSEVASVCALLEQPAVRLVTLTGPGGVGKTRLALHIATQLQERYADGVVVVALAPISDPALVGPAIAQALGLQQTGTLPPDERVTAYLRDKQVLLLLDNFEQVVAAGPLVAALLAACPRLTVLVTSRAVLHLSGEHEFPVPPLALPDAKVQPSLTYLEQVAAVQLFVERTRAVKPAFALTTVTAPAVVAICCRLDGLPLAIELAAARSKVLAPDALLRRLGNRLALLIGGARDLPARQQTIRATITWSYDLLDVAEQQLFARLSVFVGGCTLEAAEAVCGPGRDPHHTLPILEGLQTLLDNHLLQADVGADGESRFTMLETIREFALERLEASGEARALRRQHADFLLSLAETAEALLHGPEQRVWLQRLEEEHDNLRAAVAWSLTAEGSAEIAVRLAGALGSLFWYVHSHFHEARTSLDAVLKRTSGVTARGNPRVVAARAKALLAAGAIAKWYDEYRQANVLFEESLALYRDLEDPVGIAWALQQQGRTARTQGDAQRALTLLEESLWRYQEQRNTWGIAWTHVSLGEAAFDRGDVASAVTQFEAARGLVRALGDSDGAAFTLWNLGRVARLQGEDARALTLLEESLAQFRGQDNQLGVARALLELGRVACIQGKRARALQLFRESLVLQYERGGKVWVSECLAAMAGAIGAMAPDPAAASTATRLFGAAAAIRDTVGAPVPAVARADYERDVAAVRSRLDEASWTATWAEGRRMSVQEAAEYADAVAGEQGIVGGDDVPPGAGRSRPRAGDP